MSEYLWNRITPDTCECGFERKVHLNDQCPWDREDIKEFQRLVVTKGERSKFQQERSK